MIARLRFEPEGWRLGQVELVPVRLDDGSEARPVDQSGAGTILETLEGSDATLEVGFHLREDGVIELH